MSEVTGLVQVRPVVLNARGEQIDVRPRQALSAAVRSYLGERRVSFLDDVYVKHNLVVNTGRAYIARAIAYGAPQRYIAYLQLGNCQKSLNPPSLLNVGVAQEIVNLSNVPAGTFALDPGDTFFPAAARRFPVDLNLSWGSSAQVAIVTGGTTVLTDATQDFNALGVQFTDMVVLNTPSIVPVALAVKRVISATELELHNPHGFTTLAVEYRIENPGTQTLFSKLITGTDHFPASTYGPAVLVHESSWLFNDGVAWNRVVYAPHDDALGVLIQPPDAFGTQIGARFELLVNF